MKFDHIVKGEVLKGDPDRFKGQDDNALGFANQRRILIEDCEIHADGVAEALKFSRCWMVVVTKCRIIGGYEDCIDIVRGGKILIYKNIIRASKKTRSFVTIKGGVHTVVLQENVFQGKVSGPIIDLGNWTNYDIVKRPKVRNVEIIGNSFQNTKGQSLYRRIHSEKPECLMNRGDQGDCKKMAWLIRKGYWCLRRHGFLGGTVKVSSDNLVLSDEERNVDPQVNLYKRFVLDAKTETSNTEASGE